MLREATLYVAKCQNCLKRKATPDVAPLQPTVANQPMELVHMDFLSIEPSKEILRMYKPTLVKLKQHKQQLNCFGKMY